MVKFGKQVVKHRVAILIASFLLLIPSVFGYFHTRVNYDVLTYLPDDIETMQGQDQRACFQKRSMKCLIQTKER